MVNWCHDTLRGVLLVSLLLLCCRHQIIHRAERFTAAEQQQLYHSRQHCHLLWTLIRWKPDDCSRSAFLLTHLENIRLSCSGKAWVKKNSVLRFYYLLLDVCTCEICSTLLKWSTQALLQLWCKCVLLLKSVPGDSSIQSASFPP